MIQSKDNKSFVASVIAISAAMISCGLSVFGLDLMDTFYMGCLFRGDAINVLYPLSQGIYKIIEYVFGSYIIIFRIVNWLIYAASAVLIVWVSRYWIPEFWLRSALVFSSLLILPIAETNVFNANALTVLTLISVIATIIKYCESDDSMGGLLWIVPSIVCCILVRFPNIVCVPMLVVLVLLSGGISRKHKCQLLVAIVISVIAYLIICAVLFRGLNGYKASLAASLTSTAAEESTHAVSSLMNEYLHTIKDIVSHTKYVALIAIMPLCASFIKRKHIRYGIQCVFVVLITVYVLIRVPLQTVIISYPLLMFIGATISVCAFAGSVLAILHKNYLNLSVVLLCFFLPIVAAAGADTGLFLAIAPWVIASPILIGILRTEYKRVEQFDIVVLASSLLGLALSAALNVRSGSQWLGVATIVLVLTVVVVLAWLGPSRLKFPTKQYKTPNATPWPLCIVLLLFPLFALVARSQTTFHDEPINRLMYQSKEPQLRGIFTNEITANYVDDVMRAFRSFAINSDVVFWGRNSHVFQFLSGRGLDDGRDFWMEETQKNLAIIERAVENQSVIFFCPINPVTNEQSSLSEFPQLREVLQSAGYEINLHRYFFICNPPEHN